MSFLPNTLYRHNRFLDVDFSVKEIQWVSEYNVCLYGHWTLQRNHSMFLGDDTIIIKLQDLKNWVALPN